MAAAFSRAAGYCTEKSEGHRAGLGAQRGVDGLGFYRQRMSLTARPAGPSDPYNVRRSVLKDRNREESACEKRVALIRRPAQDREQP